MAPTDDQETSSADQDQGRTDESAQREADTEVTSAIGVDDELESEAEGTQQAEEKLHLDVQIDAKSACERHVTVTVPREDIDRYFDKAFGELVTKSEVPGFRAGRAPRKLVERRFHKQVSDQVKSTLLVDSLEQISQGSAITPISEPNLDAEAVVLPDDGPMTFEFDIEVRPEFDLPEWRGLVIERPVREFTDDDVERQLHNLLAQHGRLVPHDGPAETGDYLTLNLTFRDGDNAISSVEEETIRIRPVLSFRDGKIQAFDQLMRGVRAGETRSGEALLSQDAPNEPLRGKRITAVFNVLEVKKLELPELTRSFLEQLGDFESEQDLRHAIRASLARRLQYEQQRRARQQVLAALTQAADWELPPELLKRQARRELERSVLELRRSGFDEAEIRAHENELRQNSLANTARALKEHFILERIAEEQGIEDYPADYDVEIALIARQSGESPRRARAQLEKRGLMDTLRNQIIERKTVDLILKHAQFRDVPYELEATDAEAVDQAAGGGDEGEDSIPEARQPEEASPLPVPPRRE